MFSIAMLVGGVMAVQHLERSARPTVARAAPTAAPSAPQSRNLVLTKGSHGHFAVEARVDGRRLDFLVDTGASVIALNETSAARIGVRPAPRDYTANVSTANGTIKAARTRLASVEIGGIVVRDVDAMVLPDEALSENLLGLSFLSRLKRFEYANGTMVLEQ